MGALSQKALRASRHPLHLIGQDEVTWPHRGAGDARTAPISPQQAENSARGCIGRWGDRPRRLPSVGLEELQLGSFKSGKGVELTPKPSFSLRSHSLAVCPLTPQALGSAVPLKPCATPRPRGPLPFSFPSIARSRLSGHGRDFRKLASPGDPTLLAPPPPGRYALGSLILSTFFLTENSRGEFLLGKVIL